MKIKCKKLSACSDSYRDVEGGSILIRRVRQAHPDNLCYVTFNKFKNY